VGRPMGRRPRSVRRTRRQPCARHQAEGALPTNEDPRGRLA
jgi:hypothetical protein